MKLLAITGTLGNGFNAAVIDAMKNVAPEGVTIDRHTYDDVPLYHRDLDADPPAGVVRLRNAIAEADGLIICTAEYNFSIPGVLKNAIDWASRPAFESVLRNKKVAVASASPAFTGGARAQQHLKAVLLAVASNVFPWPEVCVARAHTLLEDGKLTDEKTLEFLTAFVAGFEEFVRA